MNTGIIVAKTPPLPIPHSSRESIIYIWIKIGSKIEKYYVSSNGEIDSTYLTIAASNVGETLEYTFFLTDAEILSAKNLDKPYLY